MYIFITSFCTFPHPKIFIVMTTRTHRSGQPVCVCLCVSGVCLDKSLALSLHRFV